VSIRACLIASMYTQSRRSANVCIRFVLISKPSFEIQAFDKVFLCFPLGCNAVKFDIQITTCKFCGFHGSDY
jgi:hypothetical protein